MRSAEKTESVMTRELSRLRKKVAEAEKSGEMRSRVDKILETSREDYNRLANSLVDVIWTLDTDLRFTYFSPSVTRMLGYSLNDAMTMSLQRILSPASYEIILKNLAEKLAEESTGDIEASSVWTIELEYICEDGSTIWTETKMGFVRDLAGKAIGFIGMSRDITERRRMEKQLQQTQLMASLGEMTAGIAHEVNNPLGGILLFSELLARSNVPRQMKRDLKVIHTEAKRAGRIMTDLLNFCTISTPEMRRHNLHQLLNKVLDMRRYTQSVQNIKISTNMHKSGIFVNCNASQLKHVFMHLVLNAEEALQRQGGGNIVVTTRKYGEWVRVTIADDGPGIPNEHLKQVFHPFFSTKEEGEEGTGLGLSTCHGIIASHGGLIYAENNRMGGASFVVELPMV